MWLYGRGQAGRVTMAGAKQQCKASVANFHKRAAETMKRHRVELGEDYYSHRSQEA